MQFCLHYIRVMYLKIGVRWRRRGIWLQIIAHWKCKIIPRRYISGVETCHNRHKVAVNFPLFPGDFDEKPKSLWWKTSGKLIIFTLLVEFRRNDRLRCRISWILDHKTPIVKISTERGGFHKHFIWTHTKFRLHTWLSKNDPSIALIFVLVIVIVFLNLLVVPAYWRNCQDLIRRPNVNFFSLSISKVNAFVWLMNFANYHLTIVFSSSNIKMFLSKTSSSANADIYGTQRKLEMNSSFDPNVIIDAFENVIRF